MAHDFWPPDRIVIRTPTLEVRLPSDDEFAELVAQADESIYARTGVFPFVTDWPGKPIESMQYLWRNKAEWRADNWHLALCVFADGRIVGSQGLVAAGFPMLRAVSTGSWLVADAQGKGIGTEMRTAVLHFAFAGLGALEAHSEAHVDNAASNAVSRRLGYEFTHRQRAGFRGEAADAWKMLLRREVWEQHEAHRRDDIVIEGLDDDVLAFFGAADEVGGDVVGEGEGV